MLEIEQRVFAVLLEQCSDAVWYISSSLGILVCLQGLQRLHTPEYETDDDESVHLGKEFGGHANEEPQAVGTIDKQDAGDEHKTLPHFLMLQVGEIVAQPVVVLPQGVDIIKNVKYADKAHIVFYGCSCPVVVVDDAPDDNAYEWYQCYENGPYLPFTVLQHT